MSIENALTTRHYTVTLFDNVEKRNVNEEIDKLFYETFAVKKEQGQQEGKVTKEWGGGQSCDLVLHRGILHRT